MKIADKELEGMVNQLPMIKEDTLICSVPVKYSKYSPERQILVMAEPKFDMPAVDTDKQLWHNINNWVYPTGYSVPGIS